MATPQPLDRRTLVQGAAWAVPAVAVAANAPLVAASAGCAVPVTITGTGVYNYDPTKGNSPTQDMGARTDSDPMTAQINVDGWSWVDPVPQVRIRPYVETEVALCNVTCTWVAEGFTWNNSGIAMAPVTGSDSNGVPLGDLVNHGDDNRTPVQYRAPGYPVSVRPNAATGIGTPTVSADQKTLTLTIASMPALSALIFQIDATSLVADAPTVLTTHATMTATKPNCDGTCA